MECVILELYFANTDSLLIKFLGHISQKNLPRKCFRDQIIDGCSGYLSKLGVKVKVIIKKSNKRKNDISMSLLKKKNISTTLKKHNYIVYYISIIYNIIYNIVI